MITQKTVLTFIRRLLRVDPSNTYGIHTKYGWFAIPSNYYAADWTLPQIYQELREKYPNLDETIPRLEEIQKVIDDWVTKTPSKLRPKNTKLSKKDIQIERDLQLFRFQLRDIEISSYSKKHANKDAKNQVSPIEAVKRKRQPTNKKQLYEYIGTHGKVPDDFNFNTINMLNTWNHFFAKTYFVDDPANTKSRAGKIWESMSRKEKELVKEEYILLMKQGKCYEKGKLVDLKTKYQRYIRKRPTKEGSP